MREGHGNEEQLSTTTSRPDARRSDTFASDGAADRTPALRAASDEQETLDGRQVSGQVSGRPVRSQVLPPAQELPELEAGKG